MTSLCHRGGRCKCWFGDTNGVSSFSFFSSWICGTYLLCCIAPSMAEPSYILSEVTAKVEITVGPPQFDSKFGLLLVSDREMGKKTRSHNSSGRCSTGLLSGSQIIDCNYRFCDDYFFFFKVASFTGVMRGCVISIFIEERIKTQSLKRSATGAGIAQWLERRTRDWKVAGSNPCWNGGRIFFSRVDFLCWLLFRYPFHPRVTTVARKKSRSFCQKCRWQVTAKHADTLRIEPCFGIGHNLSLICQMTSEDIKHQLNNNNNKVSEQPCSTRRTNN